jgi:hypothetical protein
MNMQSLLGMVGLGATIIFGIWAIIVTMRSNRRVQITFAHEFSIALIDDIARNLQELKITFHNEPIENDLVLMKGYLINAGKKDISLDMVEKKISFSLPEDFSWLECKIVNCSSGMTAQVIKLSESLIEFETGLWKSKEYMRFELLIKVPIKTKMKRLEDVVTFKHRITDSSEIQIVQMPFSPMNMKYALSELNWHGRSLFSGGSIFLTSLLLCIGVFMLMVGIYSHEYILEYNFPIDGTGRWLHTELSMDKVVVIDNDGHRNEYSVAEFSRFSPKSIQISRRQNIRFIYVGCAAIVLSLPMIIPQIISRRKDRKLLSMIGRNNEGL